MDGPVEFAAAARPVFFLFSSLSHACIAPRTNCIDISVLLLLSFSLSQLVGNVSSEWSNKFS